jgi:hypothetical protein
MCIELQMLVKNKVPCLFPPQGASCEGSQGQDDPVEVVQNAPNGGGLGTSTSQIVHDSVIVIKALLRIKVRSKKATRLRCFIFCYKKCFRDLVRKK